MGRLHLLEVMIALDHRRSGGGRLAGFGRQWSARDPDCSMYDQAIVRAKSTWPPRPTPPGLAAGDGAAMTAAAFIGAARGPVANASVRAAVRWDHAAASVVVVLYSVSVWIAWNDGGTERQLRLDTEQVGGAG